MSENKWVRSISFNKKNPKDVERLKLIGKKSFSRYVKKLLDEEIKRQETVEAEIPKSNGTPQETHATSEPKKVARKRYDRFKTNTKSQQPSKPLRLDQIKPD